MAPCRKPRSTFWAARSWLRKKNPDGRKLLQGLVDAQPPGKLAGDAAQTLAELDDTQGDATAALVLWQKALALATDPAVKATAAARGGWSALTAKRPADAEKLFQTARQLVPDGETRKVANTGLLRILFQQKRYTEWTKVHAAEKGSLLDSAKPEILYDLGHAQFSLKHWSEAVDGFDQFLAEFSTQDSAVTAAYERFLALAQIDRSKTVAEAESYLKAWPKSPYRARVRLLEAQELSHEKKFIDALPLWKSLVDEPATDSWPHPDIVLELARTYDELGDFPKAAATYQTYLDGSGKISPAQTLSIQGAPRRLPATVESTAGCNRCVESRAVARAGRLARTRGRARGAGVDLRERRPSAGGGDGRHVPQVARSLSAKPAARDGRLFRGRFSVQESRLCGRGKIPAGPRAIRTQRTWQQPATQRLALGAYGMKDFEKTEAYLKDYDTISAPLDPTARGRGATSRRALLLARRYGAQGRQTGPKRKANTHESPNIPIRAISSRAPGGNWAKCRAKGKEWANAVASYEKYRQLKPDAKDATTVLLALGRAELGAQDFDRAKKLGEQALLQEPEGPRSAAARMLLGETAFATQNYPEATRMFATLAVLFDDPTHHAASYRTRRRRLRARRRRQVDCGVAAKVEGQISAVSANAIFIAARQNSRLD